MNLQRLQRIVGIVQKDGTPTRWFQLLWQTLAEKVDGAVQKDSTPAWVDPTGTLARTTFATYAAPTISNPPTQAEVQALANHVQVLSQRMAALVKDLRDSDVLT